MSHKVFIIGASCYILIGFMFLVFDCTSGTVDIITQLKQDQITENPATIKGNLDNPMNKFDNNPKDIELVEIKRPTNVVKDRLKDQNNGNVQRQAPGEGNPKNQNKPTIKTTTNLALVGNQKVAGPRRKDKKKNLVEIEMSVLGQSKGEIKKGKPPKNATKVTKSQRKEAITISKMIGSSKTGKTAQLILSVTQRPDKSNDLIPIEQMNPKKKGKITKPDIITDPDEKKWATIKVIKNQTKGQTETQKKADLKWSKVRNAVAEIFVGPEPRVELDSSKVELLYLTNRKSILQCIEGMIKCLARLPQDIACTSVDTRRELCQKALSAPEFKQIKPDAQFDSKASMDECQVKYVQTIESRDIDQFFKPNKQDRYPQHVVKCPTKEGQPFYASTGIEGTYSAFIYSRGILGDDAHLTVSAHLVFEKPSKQNQKPSRNKKSKSSEQKGSKKTIVMQDIIYPNHILEIQ